MATKRTRRSRNRKSPISALAWAVLNDDPLPADHNPFEALELQRPFKGRTERRSLWNEYGAGIVVKWAVDYPGARPSSWWMYSAPRWQTESTRGAYFDGMLSEPRRRLGGTGTPSHECLNYAPHFDFGIPTSWVSAWEVEYYNSDEYRTRNPGHFDGLAIDPDDPPTFEAQASYLARHGLFLEGERERLTAADFEPEAVTAEGD